MRRHPSGEQWVIRHGEQSATIVEVGGGLRTYRVGDLDVLAGYGSDQQCSGGRGQLLVPWPNRVRDGRYSFAGTEHQLALSDPGTGNASHGLVRWALWSLLERHDSSVTVGCRLHPQQGWAAHLDLTVTYTLTDAGLLVHSRAENVGPVRAPFGYGAHPYLAVGGTPLEEVVLTLPAERYVKVDSRMLPCGTGSVEQAGLDFRSGRPLGRTRLDTAFTGLEGRDDGRWRVGVSGLRNRPGATVWAEGGFGWVQVFTPDAGDLGSGSPAAVAVEPMTCPADALNSGEGLIVLEPVQSWSGQWGVSLDG
jgi:aldose 1-epimerase